MSLATKSNQTPHGVPPQNLDAEKGALGSILLLNETFDEISEILKADFFYSDAHQRVYTAICELFDRGIRGIDPLTVAEELDRNNDLSKIGGVDYLLDIVASPPHAAHARYYAGIVREKYIERNLIYACTEILQNCYDNNENTDEILQDAEKKIFRILEQQEHAHSVDMESILLEAWDRINIRMEMDGSVSGLASGYVDLDHLTNGFQPAELVILAARPSMGKTALVCNWADGAQKIADKGVLIFSLEQSKLELAERFLCLRAKVNGHKLRSGDLEDAERHRLMEESEPLSKAKIFIDDRPGRTIAQIGALSRRMHRQYDLSLIIIDYLQLIEPEDKRIPREQQISGITRRLKGLAKELDLPVIALAQLNRGVELREDKRPRLADLRESGAIEQDADLVLFLHRPEQYDPEDHPGLAEVIVAKHRNGPTGIVNLTWRAEYMKFENFAGLDEPADGYWPEKTGNDSF